MNKSLMGILAGIVTLIVLMAAIRFMFVRQDGSPLIGKWKVAERASCGKISGFEFNHSSYTVLFTDGTSKTGAVTYSQHDVNGAFGVPIKSFSALVQGNILPLSGIDVGPITTTEFDFTLDKINNGIILSQSCEFIPE